MAVIVNQTLPWPAQQLDIDNPSRWNHLFPLIRPSVKAITTSKGQSLLLDTKLSHNKHVQLAIISSKTNLSEKFLNDDHIVALVSESGGAGLLTGRDVCTALEKNGVAFEQGLVVVRVGKERSMNVEGSLVEVNVEGELELDHIVGLVESVNESTRLSVHQTAELLKHWLKTAASTQTTFHTEKAEENPSVFHESGHAAFEDAKTALEKDLKSVLRSHSTQDGEMTYSVHYSDVNGLSKLENYILAHEIANYLDSQSIPFTLHSSALTSSTLGSRGWAISIAPIPSKFLKPSAAPPNTFSKGLEFVSTSTTVSPQVPKIQFSDADVRKRIQSGCNNLAKEEPTITEYDTIVGDGDCGLTLRDGAQKVLDYINGKDLSKLPSVLSSLVDNLEVTMGGTSGALYCIFLSSLAQALTKSSTVPEAANSALESLLKYTRARKGDRTCLDTLIPFVEAMVEGKGSEEALKRAKEGVDSTKRMKAGLGRSAYLDEKTTRGVPDPGAYGLLVLLEGLCQS